MPPASCFLSEWLSWQPQTLEEDTCYSDTGCGAHSPLPATSAAALYLSSVLPLALERKTVTQVHLGPPAASSGRWLESKACGFGFKSAPESSCQGPVCGDSLGEGGASI